MKQKLDNQWLGVILGTLAPVITLYAIFLFGYSGNSIGSFIEIIWYQNIFTRVVSISVVPNLVIFFLFIWTNRLKSARGVLAATIGYAIFVFITKLFF